MKKLYLLVFSLLIFLSLVACSASDSPRVYTVKNGQRVFTVDTENFTISDGENIYNYSLSGNSSMYDIEITYPDGSTYWWHSETSDGMTSDSGGWSDDYDRYRYIDGDILRDVLEEQVLPQPSSKNFIVIIFLLIIGILNVLSPHTAWYLEYGWRFKDAEPSEAALILSRCAGVLILIVAVFMIFV